MKNLTIVTFITLYLVLTIASIAKPDKTFSESENRILTQKPDIDIDTIVSGEFAQEYEDYINDQFVGRDKWIKIKTNIELATGKDIINGVYIGEDDYLIEKKKAGEIDTEQAQKNADRLVQFIKENRDKLGKRRVFAMLIPAPSYILGEKLPKFADTYTGDDYIEQIKTELGDNFLDCREELKSHKDEYIFYRTDHHWTTHGAYYSYKIWVQGMGGRAFPKESFNIENVAEDFYGTIEAKINLQRTPDSIAIYKNKNEYRVTYNDNYDMEGNPLEPQNTMYDYSRLETKDKYSFFLRGNNALVEIDKQLHPDIKNKRTLLIIKDSYAHCFAPFTTMHFDRVIMADLRYLNEPISALIERYNITDILVIYNVLQYMEDKNTLMLVKQAYHSQD